MLDQSMVYAYSIDAYSIDASFTRGSGAGRQRIAIWLYVYMRMCVTRGVCVMNPYRDGAVLHSGREFMELDGFNSVNPNA